VAGARRSLGNMEKRSFGPICPMTCGQRPMSAGNAAWSFAPRPLPPNNKLIGPARRATSVECSRKPSRRAGPAEATG
jgi:hypothetical protein